MLVEALATAKQRQWPVTLIGGGSNLVLTQNVAGLVIQIAIAGRKQQDTQVTLGAGENWHDAVTWSVNDCQLQGLEALALIPGSVGAAPVQNIGAYGVDLQALQPVVRAYDREREVFREWSVADAAYAYRDSRFKQQRDRHIITQVTLSLSNETMVAPKYPDLCRSLGGDEPVLPSALMEAVVQLRSQKLPDPKKLGNAGSFFKNPIIEADKVERLLKQFPSMPHFETNEGIKLSAGWLIDQCGWKGVRRGGIGVSDSHALVLVHYANENGQALMHLAAEIQDSVKRTFEVQLEPEPRII